ncbi:MAG: site-specific integrase [Acidimicrobiales bacterium]
MRDRLRTLDEAADPFPSELTVAQFAPTFLERKAPSVRPHTLNRYRSVIERDVVPVIGHVALRKVKPAHLQLVLDGVASTRGRRCVEEAKAVLSGMLKAAAAGGLVDTNAARGGTLEIRDGATRPKDLVPLEAEHVKALLRLAVGTTWEVPMNLVARLGLRRSEALALRWDDIDLDARTVTVSRSLHRVRDTTGSRLACLPPKSAASARTLAIGTPVVELLRAHGEAQRARRQLAGPAWRDDGYVTTNALEGPLDPDSMSTAFKRMATSLELPAGVRLHDLRHAAARLSLEAGAPGVGVPHARA